MVTGISPCGNVSLAFCGCPFEYPPSCWSRLASFAVRSLWVRLSHFRFSLPWICRQLIFVTIRNHGRCAPLRSGPAAQPPPGPAVRWDRSTENKKTDVAEHPQVFGHVGLLVNRLPGRVALHLVIRRRLERRRVHFASADTSIILFIARKANSRRAWELTDFSPISNRGIESAGVRVEIEAPNL
jgi:hypothetical protein